MNKKYIVYVSYILILTYLIGCQKKQEIIKVGVLHSLSGTMSISENAVAEATLMAIEEINAQGGLLGKKIVPVIYDGKSDANHFASQAEKLILKEKVEVVFGCWTSASRKTVKPIFEKHNHLLFYPIQYEGLEQSPNIVYTGAAPNQQIIPAIKWSFDYIGKRFLIVGSDYVFPRTASAIMQDLIAELGGEVLADEYILLGSQDVQAMVDKIVALEPDVILNNINGDSNVAFFKALREAGISPENIPVFSFSIAEDELRSLDVRQMVGNYVAWNYFQSISSPENAQFVKNYKKKYGQDRVTDDPIEAGYISVYLWAEAVREAGTTEIDKVKAQLPNRSFQAPGGLVYIDAATQHTWKSVYIGKIREDAQIDILWSSHKPVKPKPFPNSRSRQEWERFLNTLYSNWNQQWANLGK